MARGDLKKTRLGPGQGGGDAWVLVRLNSFGLLVLFAWLLTSLLILPNLEYETALAWLRQPINSILMILLIVLTFQHSHYGLKEVIDDYVHEAGAKTALTFLLYAFSLIGTLFGVWWVLTIRFASP